jgi:hypothetical protein
MLIRTVVLGSLAVLAGCSSLEPKDFAQGGPRFDPVAYFAGHASAWGVMEDGSGNPTKTFRAEDEGRRDGDSVVISQTISYSDGEVQKRSWKLRRLDEHHFEGTADDIVGVAEGEADGNALQLSYTVAPSPTNPLTHVHLNQWLYLQADGKTVLSRTTISKLGVVVVRVAEYVRRDGAAADGPAAP